MRPAGGGAGPPPRTCERWGAGGLRLLLVLLDVADRVADGLDVAELVVGDRDAELVLDGGGDLDHRQGVDVEVVGERLLRGRVGGRDAGDPPQDLGQTGLDVLAAHAGSSLSKGALRQSGGSAVGRDRMSRRSGVELFIATSPKAV